MFKSVAWLPTKIIVSILALVLIAPAIASAECDPRVIQVAAATGAAAAAVSAGPPANASRAWVLQDFYISCGKAAGAPAEAVITVSGLQGSGTPTYYLDESTTAQSTVTDNFHGTPASGQNTAITVSMPAVTSGGPCTVTVRYCQ